MFAKVTNPNLSTKRPGPKDSELSRFPKVHAFFFYFQGYCCNYYDNELIIELFLKFLAHNGFYSKIHEAMVNLNATKMFSMYFHYALKSSNDIKSLNVNEIIELRKDQKITSSTFKNNSSIHMHIGSLHS